MGFDGHAQPGRRPFSAESAKRAALSRPTVGPNWTVKRGESFDAFRTFEILNDTTERERYFLAQRRFYGKLAPQSAEHPLRVLAPNARELGTLGPLIDQMAELGFELLQAPAFTGSFSHSDSLRPTST